MTADCLFCRMAAGEIPVPKVHEDDLVFAIRDINPQAPTHVLVIPVAHIASAADLARTTRRCWAACSRSPPTSPAPRASTAAGGWSPTSGPTPASPSSTCTSTCSAGGAMGWPPG